MDAFIAAYPALLPHGSRTLANYLAARIPGVRRLFRWSWIRGGVTAVEGANLDDAAAMKRAVRIPVLCTGGFQTASVIRQAIAAGRCDAVTIARPLVANNDLVHLFAKGVDRPDRPCSYCNRCLANVVVHPLGCYDEARFPSREAMIAEIMSVFDPAPFAESAVQVRRAEL